jgi:hypothetical protein
LRAKRNPDNSETNRFDKLLPIVEQKTLEAVVVPNTRKAIVIKHVKHALSSSNAADYLEDKIFIDNSSLCKAEVESIIPAETSY